MKVFYRNRDYIYLNQILYKYVHLQNEIYLLWKGTDQLCREFLDELCQKTGLNMHNIVHKIERCGKPAHNAPTKCTANPTNPLTF